MSVNSIDSDQYVDGSIDTAHIAASNITNALMADDAIGIAELSATGTASSTSYLRGDNVWDTIGGGTTINSNTNNYVITGTGTANTLQGESGLLFSDGRNLGLGVTPETNWANDDNAIQIGGLGGLWGKTTAAAAKHTTLSNNVYDHPSTGQAAIVTDEGAKITLTNGTILLTTTAAATTADAAHSWNTGINMLATGYVGIGTASPSQLLHMVAASGDCTLRMEGDAVRIKKSGSDFLSYDGSNTKLSTGNTEVFRLNSSKQIVVQSNATSGTGTGVIAHHTNNNMYIRGGSESLNLGGGSASEANRGFVNIPEGNNNLDLGISGTTRFRVRHDGTTFMGPNTSGQIHVIYNSSYVTMADDATITLSGVANTGVLISIGSYRKSGQNVTYAHGLIFLGYHIGTTGGTIISDVTGFLRNSDTDGYICVYKTAGSGNVTVKNRLGISNNVSMTIHRYQGN
jgi:hypothetical protein